MNSDWGSSTNSNEQDDGRRVPAGERVLSYILAEMDAGTLRPGERVNAARIAATLNLSLAPVREALSVLAGRGVLDLLPDRGAVMRPLTPTDVVHLWEVLAPVAAKGLELAAQVVATGSADTHQVVQAYEAIGHEPSAVPPLKFILRLNDYHWAVNRLAGNPYLTVALETLGVPYWDRYLVELVDVRANINGYLTNYRRIHESVMAGDGPAAAAVMHYHANWSVKLVREGEARLAANSSSRRRRGPKNGSSVR